MRLDTWLEAAGMRHTGVVDFIWADLQGAEGDMVLGGTQTLRQTRWLFTETYHVEMYEGQLTTDQLCAVLRLIGFEPERRYPSENMLFKNMRFQ
jgi:hypothetical protein